MTGVDNLDPKKDGVEESQSSPESEGSPEVRALNEHIESSDEQDTDSTKTTTNENELSDSSVVAHVVEGERAATVDADKTVTSETAGAPSHSANGDQEEPDVASQVPPRNQSVSPTPIPVLDRPPSNPHNGPTAKDINAIYDGVDVEIDADADGKQGSDEPTQRTVAGADTEHEADLSVQNADNGLAGGDLVGGALDGDVLDDDATTVMSRIVPEGEVVEDEKAPATHFGIPVVEAPTAKASYTEQGVSSEATEPNSNASAMVAKSNEPSTNQNLLDGFEDEKSGRGGVKAIIGVFATILVLGGAYVGAQYAFADQIAKNVSVAGVDVGGMTHSDAVTLLNEKLKPRLDEKMALRAGDVEASLIPAEAGISLDVDATLTGQTGLSWSPTVLWKHLTGGEPIDPVLKIDQEALIAAATDVSGAFYVEPVNGTVAFVDARAVATAAEDGAGVEPDVIADMVESNLFTEQRPVELSVVPVSPEVTQEATDAALKVAETIASAAVTVNVDGQTAEIPQEAFTEDVSVKFVDGAAQFAFDGEKLSNDVVKRTTDLLKESEDARFVFVDGKPEIESGEAGTTIDQEALSTAFLTAATSPTDRIVEAVLVETDPEQSVEKLEKLGIKELVASFSTPITNESLRTANLKVAAERITGYLVEPGKQFDLLKVIGPVTAANGYHSAGVIVNGVHTDGVGGGLSQVATTTYNAGFFAGMTDIAHRPHSVWFKRYPEGRESTMFVGSIDMIWQNDSETGILMRSYVSGGKLTVEAWGTKTYKVETTTSPRSNVRAATMTTSTDPRCAYYPVGEPGFTVTVTRKVTELLTGEVVKDEANTWTYRPDNGVTCKKEEPKKDTSKDKSKDD